jgi:hypothetical protein
MYHANMIEEKKVAKVISKFMLHAGVVQEFLTTRDDGYLCACIPSPDANGHRNARAAILAQDIVQRKLMQCDFEAC